MHGTADAAWIWFLERRGFVSSDLPGGGILPPVT
jgi:hypothetical protein